MTRRDEVRAETYCDVGFTPSQCRPEISRYPTDAQFVHHFLAVDEVPGALTGKVILMSAHERQRLIHCIDFAETQFNALFVRAALSSGMRFRLGGWILCARLRYLIGRAALDLCLRSPRSGTSDTNVQ